MSMVRRPSERPPRIRDVAAAAGVSTATVSRALSFPEKLRADTRTRVLETVRRLGYRPNATARELRMGTSKMVLVVVPSRANPPFFAEVLRGIDEELSAAGYALIMGTLDDSPGRARWLADLVFARRLDGVVVLSGRVPADIGSSISEAGVPLVSVCAEIDAPGASAVLLDDAAAAMVQARHLLELGHRRLMYVAGPEGNYNEVHRYRGFLAAVDSAGLRRRNVIRHPGDYLVGGGIAAARSFLAMSPRPTGVACCNDEMAIGFIKTLAGAGVAVPKDVSVIGFDGIEFGEFCEPTLTTIEQPRFELGARGARVLIEALGSGRSLEPTRIVLEGTLVVRESTGPAPLQAPAFSRRRPTPSSCS